MNKEERKPKIRIGTIGHVAHGKTSLTAAIVKYFGDMEETERIKNINISRGTKKD